MMLLIAIAIFLAVLHAVLWWQAHRAARAMRRQWQQDAASPEWPQSRLLQATLPMASWLARYVAQIPRVAQWRWTIVAVPPLVLAIQSVILAIGFGGLIAIITPVARGLVTTLAISLAAALPWFDLHVFVRRRRAALTREWGRFLDLLALCMEAGLELLPAVAALLDAMAPSVLQRLLRQWYQEMRLGQSREAAWRHFVHHAQHPEIGVHVALLQQAQRFGTPLGDILREQAALFRERRLHRAELAGAVASHKILVPVICCIMPAYFLLTFGGILIRVLMGDWTELW